MALKNHIKKPQGFFGLEVRFGGSGWTADCEPTAGTWQGPGV